MPPNDSMPIHIGDGTTSASSPVIDLLELDSAELGLQHQEMLAEEITADGRPRLLVWRSPPALIVGRSDTRLPHFVAAAERLTEEGWPVVVRRSGGSACPVSRGTLQIVLSRPEAPGLTIDSFYGELTALIARLASSYGLKATTGEKPDAFCPGRFDMSIAGRKIVGISQHWRPFDRQFRVTTAATLIVEEDLEAISEVVNLFYRTAGGSQRCSVSAIGSLKQALSPDADGGEALVADLCRRLARIAS